MERRGILVGREGDSDNIMDAVAAMAMAMATVRHPWESNGGKGKKYK